MLRPFLFVWLIFLSINFIQAQGNHPVFSARDVFELEWASDPQISPDGQQVVYVRRGFDLMKDRAKGQLWLYDIATGAHQKLTSREVSESSPRWSPQGDRIAFVSSGTAGAEVYLYWVNSGKVAILTQLERSPGGITWSPDGSQLAFSMLVPEKSPVLVKPLAKPKGADWADPPRVTTRLKHEADGSGYIEPGYRQYFIIPAEGGTARQVSAGDFKHDNGVVWMPDGQALIFSGNRNENWEHDWRNSELYRLKLATGEISPLTDRKGPDRGAVVSPNGKTIAYLGYDDKVQTYQLTRLYLMDADGGNQRELDLDLDRSVSSLTWDADGSGLYFSYDDHGITHIGHTPLNGKVSTIASDLGGTTIGRPYGGGSYSFSAASNRMVFTHTRPDHPADLALLQLGGDNIKRLTHLNDDLLAYRKLGEVEPITYTSSVDQREIQGWIVKPPHYDPSRKYPMLVENHGGPISNYGERFSAEMQLYAAADYIVFYPNPRGSTSYGEEFGNLLYHNYPGDDYQDVMDGVDVLIKRGVIHPDSLYVTGGSAGGIMTAWIIGKNDRFRAAAVVKPVMNWISKTLTADNYYGYAFSRYPGWPWENIDTYMKFSPISLVGNVQTPTLVMVGTADLRTPLSEAKQLYHALKIREIETALVEIPGAYHNISRRPSQLVTKVAHVLAWFERYR